MINESKKFRKTWILCKNLNWLFKIIDIDIEMVQTSCGMSIPYFDFKEERLQLDEWAQNKGEEGIKEYWKEKNEVSIDGIPTQIQEGY